MAPARAYGKSWWSKRQDCPNISAVTTLLRILVAFAGIAALAIGVLALFQHGFGDLFSAACYLLAGAAQLWGAYAASDAELRATEGKDTWRLVLGGLLAMPSALVLLGAWTLERELSPTALLAAALVLGLGLLILFFELP
jgi:hypothetical protein